MRYAFFTGATGGLGGSVIQALSKTGRWTVFAAGTNDAALARLGQMENVIPLQVDVTCQESIDNAHEAVQTHTDSLDAVVNFAGAALFTSMVEGDCSDRIQELLEINVMGMVRVNRTFFDLVHRGRGRIVNCSSESGWMTPQPFAGPYCLTKYAVEAYNDSLRRELMYLGIPVVKIQPGFYKTRLTDSIFSGFDKTVAESRYYGTLLARLKPLLMLEMTRKNDPKRLVRVVLKALEAKRPRLRYRAGTGWLLALLELLPDAVVDWFYRLAYRTVKSCCKNPDSDLYSNRR